MSLTGGRLSVSMTGVGNHVHTAPGLPKKVMLTSPSLDQRVPSMRLPTMARSRAKTLLTLAAAGLMLAACADQATAPVASAPGTQERTSRFAPTDAQLDLVGVSDGVYT